jgi:hypothetical protein
LQARIENSDHEQVVLRWREGPALAAREAEGEVLEARLREAVIRCSLQINEQTEVQILAGSYRETGVVRSCRAEENDGFVLSIRITSAPELEAPHFERDPGMLAVESFLTDEQADKILEELDLELGPDCDESSATRRALRQLLTSFRLLQLGSVLGRMCAKSRVTTGSGLWLNKV